MIILRLVLFVIIFAIDLVVAPILGLIEMFKQAGQLWGATGKKRATPEPAQLVNCQYPLGYTGVDTAEQPKLEGKTTMSAEDWAKVSLVHWEKEGHS
jgi:hypothetical protein